MRLIAFPDRQAMKAVTAPSDTSNDPILTTRAAANILGVSVSTAQLWIESGAIASWKTPGGHRRVRLSAVMELLERQQGRPSNTDSGAVPDAGMDQDALAGAAAQFDPEFCAANAPDYPVPANEGQRLRALAATRLVDSAPEPVFDRLTWLACQITQAPMALVSLLTARRQWFKARTGLDVTETPREWAFCSHAILNKAPLVIEDAHRDPRFVNNPLVTGAPHIRFYVGFPLFAKDGLPLGTLCVLDRTPRKLTPEQLRGLEELAAIATEEILRRG